MQADDGRSFARVDESNHLLVVDALQGGSRGGRASFVPATRSKCEARDRCADDSKCSHVSLDCTARVLVPDNADLSRPVAALRSREGRRAVAAPPPRRVRRPRSFAPRRGEPENQPERLGWGGIQERRAGSPAVRAESRPGEVASVPADEPSIPQRILSKIIRSTSRGNSRATERERPPHELQLP